MILLSIPGCKCYINSLVRHDFANLTDNNENIFRRIVNRYPGPPDPKPGKPDQRRLRQSRSVIQEATSTSVRPDRAVARTRYSRYFSRNSRRSEDRESAAAEPINVEQSSTTVITQMQDESAWLERPAQEAPAASCEHSRASSPLRAPSPREPSPPPNVRRSVASGNDSMFRRLTTYVMGDQPPIWAQQLMARLDALENRLNSPVGDGRRALPASQAPAQALAQDNDVGANHLLPGQWRTGEVGFFDPSLSAAHGPGDVVAVGNDVYYRSVQLFIERLKDAAAVKGAPVVRANASSCLRGAALMWYSQELSSRERTIMRYDDNGIEEWCTYLLNRFKESPSVALNRLSTERYTVEDADQFRETTPYVQAVLRHAKSAGFTTTLQQLSWAWNNIDPALRLHITEPNEQTTVALFIDEVNRKKMIWQEDAMRRRAIANEHVVHKQANIVQGNTDMDLLVTKEPAENDDQVEELKEQQAGYLNGPRLYIVVAGLCVAVLLVSLDQAILATAIPTITSYFNSLEDIGWYGAAFFISICAFQPLAGKLFMFFSLKWMYLIFLAIFEVGSLVCAVAPSSAVLIVGRAIAGIGSAGLFSGALTIIAHTIPLRLRPLYTAFVGSMFGIANIAGPLLGGALTQHVSWRWCFYINLPCGAVTLFALVLFFSPPKRRSEDIPFLEKMKGLDPLGFLLFVPVVTMLLLAVQWGGSKYAWSSATIIGLFCGSGGLFIVFSAWQYYQQDEASIPPSIFPKQRTVFFGSLTAFSAMGAMEVTIYWLPLWFQVIKGVSASESGVMNLPSILGNVILSILAAGAVMYLGYFNPWLLMGTALTAAGAGLLTTFTTSTGHGYWIGYQVLFGAGIGCSIQMPLLAVQAVLPLKQVSTATAVVVFFQFLGGALLLAVGQSIFQTRLLEALRTYAPAVNAEHVIGAGAALVRETVSVADLPGVLEAYNDAITRTFYVAVAGGGLAFLTALGMQWPNVKNIQIGGVGAV